MSVRDLVLISVLSSILFVSEQVLTFIPNVQITFLLIIVYSKVLNIKQSIFIILIHVLLDNLFMGSLNFIYLPFMFVAYCIIPVTLKFIVIESEIKLAFMSVLFSMLYCLIFVIPSCYTTGVNIKDYIIADIPFTIILSISSFVSVLWLYKPISTKLIYLKNKNNS